jgi:hypothetical protein
MHHASLETHTRQPAPPPLPPCMYVYTYIHAYIHAHIYIWLEGAGGGGRRRALIEKLFLNREQTDREGLE